MTVSVGALMIALETAESCRGTRRGDSTFVHSRDRWGVVRSVFQGGIAHVMAMGHDVHLSQQARVFQVAVGDISCWVGGRHKASLDFGWEGLPPYICRSFAVKVHSTHARLGCVSGAQESRLLRDYLG